jgi:hypothetical protein
VTGAAAPTADPRSLIVIAGRQYRALLVLATVIGVLVSVASWAFLERRPAGRAPSGLLGNAGWRRPPRRVATMIGRGVGVDAQAPADLGSWSRCS